LDARERDQLHTARGTTLTHILLPSDTFAGHTNGNKLPVVHRLSPCSPLAGGGARKHGKPSLHEILHRDSLRLRYLSQVRAATAAAAPAPSPSADQGFKSPAIAA